MFYLLKLSSNSMRVMVPTSNVESVGLRRVSKSNEIGNVLDFLVKGRCKSPADWKWPNVPFATSCGNDPDYGRCIQDMPHEFYGGIETDKIGELGIGYVLFYEMTGEEKYLEAGIHCADALAQHVRPGDADHTPWPFRVDARTGAVLDGEEYGGMITSPLRLVGELIRLKKGDGARSQREREKGGKGGVVKTPDKGRKAWGKGGGDI